MRYDFTGRERKMGRVILALTLDKKRMTERIVIGRTDETRLRLERGTGEVYYDETSPLGSLLLNFESDKNGEWNKQGLTLRESYGKTLLTDKKRWKISAPVSEFLQSKYDGGEPSAVFAAIRTWEDYLNCFNLNHGADLLTDKLSMLYRPFIIYADYKPWRDESAAALSNALRDGESNVELWYLEQQSSKPTKRKGAATKKARVEIIAASLSFLPIIFYYLNKAEEWRFTFQECKVCGKYFLARSRHYELCSDECRKKQAVEAKREFDERIKGDRLEQLDEAAYFYWYNRLRKLKRGKHADTEKAAVVSAAFKAFRKEAVKRKGEVKRGGMKLAEFSSWLMKQQDAVDALMAQDKK